MPTVNRPLLLRPLAERYPPDLSDVILRSSTIRFLVILVLFVAAMILPEIAFATTPTATDTGFGEVAWEIYDALDNDLGLVIGLLGGGLSVVSMIRGMNGVGIASGAGIAVSSQILPDVIVTLNGGLLLP